MAAIFKLYDVVVFIIKDTLSESKKLISFSVLLKEDSGGAEKK